MRRKSNTVFLDFFLLIGLFAFMMFIKAFILINVPEEGKKIDPKAEFIIQMSWPDKSANDIDLWLMAPDGAYIYYNNQEDSGITLERDDIGIERDQIELPNGEIKEIYVNYEHVVIRNVQPGWYHVNTQYYATKANPAREQVLVKVIKLNPYDELHQEQFQMLEERSEKHVVSFKVDREGKVLEVKKTGKMFANRITQQNVQAMSP